MKRNYKRLLDCLKLNVNGAKVLNYSIKMKTINLREAVKDDCKEIRRLIQELADFEKMPDGPKIDYKVLEEDGFGSNHPSFRCIILEELDDSSAKGKLVGCAIYYITYSTWAGKAMYLEDLYVSPEYRGQGFGSKLFHAIAKKGQELGCKRMDLRVLQWNPAMHFYLKKGGIDLTSKFGWHNIGFDNVAMDKLAADASE